MLIKESELRRIIRSLLTEAKSAPIISQGRKADMAIMRSQAERQELAARFLKVDKSFFSIDARARERLRSVIKTLKENMDLLAEDLHGDEGTYEKIDDNLSMLIKEFPRPTDPEAVPFLNKDVYSGLDSLKGRFSDLKKNIDLYNSEDLKDSQLEKIRNDMNNINQEVTDILALLTEQVNSLNLKDDVRIYHPQFHDIGFLYQKKIKKKTPDEIWGGLYLYDIRNKNVREREDRPFYLEVNVGEDLNLNPDGKAKWINHTPSRAEIMLDPKYKALNEETGFNIENKSLEKERNKFTDVCDKLFLASRDTFVNLNNFFAAEKDFILSHKLGNALITVEGEFEGHHVFDKIATYKEILQNYFSEIEYNESRLKGDLSQSDLESLQDALDSEQISQEEYDDILSGEAVRKTRQEREDTFYVQARETIEELKKEIHSHEEELQVFNDLYQNSVDEKFYRNYEEALQYRKVKTEKTLTSEELDEKLIEIDDKRISLETKKKELQERYNTEDQRKIKIAILNDMNSLINEKNELNKVVVQRYHWIKGFGKGDAFWINSLENRDLRLTFEECLKIRKHMQKVDKVISDDEIKSLEDLQGKIKKSAKQVERDAKGKKDELTEGRISALKKLVEKKENLEKKISNRDEYTVSYARYKLQELITSFVREMERLQKIKDQTGKTEVVAKNAEEENKLEELQKKSEFAYKPFQNILDSMVDKDLQGDEGIQTPLDFKKRKEKEKEIIPLEVSKQRIMTKLNDFSALPTLSYQIVEPVATLVYGEDEYVERTVTLNPYQVKTQIEDFEFKLRNLKAKRGQLGIDSDHVKRRENLEFLTTYYEIRNKRGRSKSDDASDETYEILKDDLGYGKLASKYERKYRPAVVKLYDHVVSQEWFEEESENNFYNKENKITKKDKPTDVLDFMEEFLNYDHVIKILQEGKKIEDEIPPYKDVLDAEFYTEDSVSVYDILIYNRKNTAEKYQKYISLANKFYNVSDMNSLLNNLFIALDDSTLKRNAIKNDSNISSIQENILKIESKTKKLYTEYDDIAYHSERSNSMNKTFNIFKNEIESNFLTLLDSVVGDIIKETVKDDIKNSLFAKFLNLEVPIPINAYSLEKEINVEQITTFNLFDEVIQWFTNARQFDLANQVVINKDSKESIVQPKFENFIASLNKKLLNISSIRKLLKKIEGYAFYKKYKKEENDLFDSKKELKASKEAIDEKIAKYKKSIKEDIDFKINWTEERPIFFGEYYEELIDKADNLILYTFKSDDLVSFFKGKLESSRSELENYESASFERNPSLKRLRSVNENIEIIEKSILSLKRYGDFANYESNVFDIIEKSNFSYDEFNHMLSLEPQEAQTFVNDKMIELQELYTSDPMFSNHSVATEEYLKIEKASKRDLDYEQKIIKKLIQIRKFIRQKITQNKKSQKNLTDGYALFKDAHSKKKETEKKEIDIDVLKKQFKKSWKAKFKITAPRGIVRIFTSFIEKPEDIPLEERMQPVEEWYNGQNDDFWENYIRNFRRKPELHDIKDLINRI